MNLCSSVSRSVLSLALLGNSGNPLPFWQWVGHCKVCGKRLEGTKGLFCANFHSCQMHWKPCESAWCGSCYLPHSDDRFHRFVPRDEGGFAWSASQELQRYQVGRDGNHLVTVFQCDDCIFLNLLHRRPLSHSTRDNLTLCCIRRMNLDALWGRETSTVDSTARAVRQTITLLQPLGIRPQYPPLGPFPLDDSL